MHCWTPELGSSSFPWFCLTPPPVFVSFSGPILFGLSTQGYNFNRTDKKCLILIYRCHLILRALFWESFIISHKLSQIQQPQKENILLLNFFKCQIIIKRYYLFLVYISCLYLLLLKKQNFLLIVSSKVCITVSVEVSLVG